MTKTTFYKKYTLTDLCKLAAEKGIVSAERIKSEGYNKKQLVDIVYPALFLGDSEEINEAELVTSETEIVDPDAGAEDYPVDPKTLIEFVFSEGILYKVDAHCWWGKSSKCREGEVNGDPDVISGVKVLMDPASMANLKSYRAAGERIVKRRAYNFLGLRGVYFIPKAYISGVEAGLKECQTNFYGELTDFIEEFPQLQKDWEVKSGTLYDQSLYPSRDELRSKFSFNWTKFMISLPDSNMGILDEEEYKEELEKQRNNLRIFLDSALQTLAKELLDIVTEFQEKIDKGETVNKRRLETVKTFVNEFDKMNITNNVELSQLADTFKSAVGKASTDDFDNGIFQRTFQKKTAGIVKAIKNSENEAIKRAIEF